MHLSSLTLTNIRQFDQRTFRFQPGFNLLVGENGAGKTTILRGLVAALGGMQQRSRRLKLEDDDIRLHATHAEVEAEVHLSDSYREIFYFRKSLWERAQTSRSRNGRPLVLLYASNEAICSAMRVKRAKRIRGSEDLELRLSEEYLFRAENEFVRRRERSSDVQFGNSYPVREFLARVLSTFSPDFRDFYWSFEPYDCSLVVSEKEKWDPIMDAELEEIACSAALRFFQEDWPRRRKNPYVWPDQSKVVLNPRESERMSDGGRFPDPREIWERMSMPKDAKEKLQSASLEVKLTPRIMIQRQIGPLRLSQLSDGEQRLFSLFVDIARQLSLQNPHQRIGEGEAIVLIDEIDVHLHPKWQRKIVPAMEDLFQNCQFIATTHSPFVIQAVAAHRLQDLNHELMGDINDRGIEEIAVKVMGIEVPQVSARYLEMLDTAKQYFTLLENADVRSDAQRENLKTQLRGLSRRYADNPAYQAYLEIHGQLELGPDELR